MRYLKHPVFLWYNILESEIVLMPSFETNQLEAGLNTVPNSYGEFLGHEV